MLAADASSNIHNIANNNINIEVVSEIQKELDSVDIVSMVFLLYDVPATALERLVLFQRTSKNCNKRYCNLLSDWAIHSQARLSWKYEFLEALMICQLYKVIRKLGFDVQSVKRTFPRQESYINPMKRELYELCENMTSTDLDTFKQTLLSYEIETQEHETCEVVMLVLMNQEFITVPQNFKTNSQQCSIENLSTILELNSHLKVFASRLKDIQNKVSNKNTLEVQVNTSTPNDAKFKKNGNDKTYANDFDDVFKMFDDLKMDVSDFNFLRADSQKTSDNAYEIKNPKSVGVCYIINIETFYPSKESIEEKTELLHNRLGSTKDKISLERTMTALNFDVISHDNLSKNEMIQNISNVVKKKVRKDHSVFVLCIMSHGVNGHVYAANNVKVRIDQIQSLLYSDEAVNLRDIPKVMVLQACRVNNDQNKIQLVADSPNPKQYFMKYSDFFTICATSPQYEAYRCPKRGSIFIQIFCRIMSKYAKYLSLYEMCLKVNHMVKTICTKLECEQLPEITFNINKNIFFQ